MFFFFIYANHHQSCWVNQDHWIGSSKVILCQTLYKFRLRDNPYFKIFHSKSGFACILSTVWGHKHIVACCHEWFCDTHKCTRHCFTPQEACRTLPRSCVVLASDEASKAAAAVVTITKEDVWWCNSLD